MTNSQWHSFDYNLKFHLGEFTAGSVTLPVKRRVFTLDEIRDNVNVDAFPPLDGRLKGYLLANIPETTWNQITAMKPVWLLSTLKSYQRCYIDMSGDFDQYKNKFSSKSRSGINRKVKRFSNEAGGLDFRLYRTSEEIEQFFALATEVSAASYQERLLDCGLPRDPASVAAARSAAQRNEVRAFLLFAEGRPVSYLYCPVEDDILQYAFLGYIPEYARLSPGTVLQWLAMEALFSEKRFRAFDFTEGDSDHKRFFSTHQVPCKVQLILRPTLQNRSLVRANAAIKKASDFTASTLDKFGLKQKLKKLIRKTA